MAYEFDRRRRYPHEESKLFMPIWNQSGVRGATDPATLVECSSDKLFEPAHLFQRHRRDYRSVNCKTQVIVVERHACQARALESTSESSSRYPLAFDTAGDNVELVVFNVLTAVERLFANSGVRQGVQPGEIGDIARS
ncbi:hypothetical protein [Paraburkholderia sp. SIMBA_030]|uniref:hypothetical protein n=1 Tax=Paraburkholderia sp. SIMBA_030 TaxID=3085773 RepID=UPI00397871CD